MFKTIRILHLAIVHQNVSLTLAIISAMVKRHQEKVNGIDVQNKLRQVKIILLMHTSLFLFFKLVVKHETNFFKKDYCRNKYNYNTLPSYEEEKQ